MNLPIDLIDYTNPPRFRWTQTVATPVGVKIVEMDGRLPVAIEEAVEKLILLVRTQAQEIDQLRKINEGLTRRIPAQKPVPVQQEVPVKKAKVT